MLDNITIIVKSIAFAVVVRSFRDVILGILGFMSRKRNEK